MVRTLTLLFVLAMPLAGFAQGKLEAVREAVDKPPFAIDKDSASTKSATTSNDDDSDSDGAFGGFFFYVIASPWTVPNAMFDRGTKYESKFSAYPYAASDSPYLLFDYWDLPKDGRPKFSDRTDTQWYSVRASTEVGSDFDGLNRVGLKLFLDTDTRFGLKSDWDWYTERLPCGCRDEFWLGDVTATYRFVQNERLMMHTGLGGRVLLDHGHDRGGVNFLYGFDAFPIRPVHLFGSFEAGTLGNAGFWRLRGGVGVNWTHAELFAGYDFVRIDEVNLQGPMIGLRLWY